MLGKLLWSFEIEEICISISFQSVFNTQAFLM